MRKWHIILCNLGLLLLGSLGMARAGTVTYIYTYTQGTPVMESDAKGNITAQLDYTPYGTQALGNPPDGPGYTGHVNDPDTGLVYMQARYYDPEVGSFLSLDPVGPTPGDLFAFNRYDYAGNNPVKNIDPDGRAFGFDDAAGILIGGAIGLVVETGKDVFVSQRLPTKGEAFGSIVSGAILGEGTVNAPETAGASAAIVWGGAAGAAGNFVQQTVDVHDGTQKELSVKSFAVSTIFGAIAGGVVSKLLPEAGIPGASAGRNNFNAIRKGMLTKAENGTAQSITTKTAAKMALGSQASEAYRTLGGAAVDAAKSKACSIKDGVCE